MDGPRAAAYTAFIFSRRIRIFCTTINYQYAAKGRGVYGLIGRKHITSVLPVREKAAEPPAQTVGRSFFCGRPVEITLAKREGLLRGLPDFRDDAYRRVVIDSFELDD